MTDLDSLGPAGLALWDGIKAERGMPATHIPLVINACRLADRLNDISDELASQSLTSFNDRGDKVANPLLGEHRQQLLALRQVLASLGVDKLPIQTENKPQIADLLAAQREKRRLARQG